MFTRHKNPNYVVKLMVHHNPPFRSRNLVKHGVMHLVSKYNKFHKTAADETIEI